MYKFIFSILDAVADVEAAQRQDFLFELAIIIGVVVIFFTIAIIEVRKTKKKEEEENKKDSKE